MSYVFRVEPSEAFDLSSSAHLKLAKVVIAIIVEYLGKKRQKMEQHLYLLIVESEIVQ